MNTASERLCYQPSGRVEWARLGPALLPPVLVSAGMAAALFGLLVANAYLAAFAVILPAAVAAAVTRSAVKSAHCRSRALAGALGAACGLVGFAGSYHLDQCLRWGAPWTAVGRLPGYVAFRLETDHWRLIGKGAILEPPPAAPGVQPVRRPAGVHWLTWNGGLFLFDLLLLMCVPLGVGWVAASEPYSEGRRRWCSREVLTLDPAAGTALRTALEQDTLRAWVEAGPRKVGTHQPHGTVSVWYTPAAPADDPDFEVFVRVGKGPYLRLTPAEAAALVQLLPGVQDLAGPSRDRLAAEAARAGDPASARVWPVPPPYAGMAQNPRNRLLGRCLGLGLLMGPPLAAVAVLIGGTWLLATLGDRKLVSAPLIAGYVVTVGILCVGFLSYWFRPERLMPRVRATWFHHRLLRRAVARRPDPLVAADDGRAVFAEMAPRRLWTAGRAECGEYNQGLLRIDAEAGGLLFEGDYERYWIPAAAILSGDVEALPGITATTMVPHAVVLHVRLGGGVWEFPFFPLDGIEGHNAWQKTTALRRRIEALCGRPMNAPAAPPPAPRPVVVG